MATMDTKLLANSTDPSARQQALHAFLAEKERRSGSWRTVESGEIFVSGVIRELVSGQPFAFDDLGEWPMKGFEQPVRVWSVRWA
jgi:hypothetical protein